MMRKSPNPNPAAPRALATVFVRACVFGAGLACGWAGTMTLLAFAFAWLDQN